MPSPTPHRSPTLSPPSADTADTETPSDLLAALPHAPNRGELRFFGKVGDPEVIREALEVSGGRFLDHVVDRDVATRVVTHLAGYHGVLETRSGTAPPMVVHGDAHGTAYLAVGDDAPPSVYYHELAHLLFDAYGYVTDPDAADGGAASREGDGDGAVQTAVVRERAYRRGDDPDPFVAAPGVGAAGAAGAANLELRKADPAVAPKAAAFDPRVAALADAVNTSWRRIHRVQREAPERLAAVLPNPRGEDANVVSVHAHELAAVWAEVFLEEGTPSRPANWFFEHPELTAAFCRVVRPSSGVCRVANHLHRAFPDRSPWVETPYPELWDHEGSSGAVAEWAASTSSRVEAP